MAGHDILFQTFQNYYTISYSLNGTDHLEAFRWVYLVGIPQTNPMVFRLDPGSDTSWYTTTLPSTEDGKVYIRLGFYGGYASFTLHAEHPAYWFKDGFFRPYLTRGDIS